MASFTDVEFFPWAETQLEQLWNGEVYTIKDDPKTWWSYLVMKWKNTAAVCGGKVVRLISTLPQRQGHPIFQVALPEGVSNLVLLRLSTSHLSQCRFTLSRVKWALNPWSLHPLLLYIHSSVLHVFDVESRVFLGCIRGHGGVGVEIAKLGSS